MSCTGPTGSVRALPALTPEHAISLLRLLSTDLREAAVLDAAGARLAGDDALAAQAAPLVPPAPGEAVRAGDLLVVAGPRHAVAVRTGPHVLDGLLLADLHGVLADLG